MNTANTDLKFLTNSLVLAGLPAILGEAKTPNWYDPCGLLGEDGPSELKPEFRERLRGGGWYLANHVDAGK